MKSTAHHQNGNGSIKHTINAPSKSILRLFAGIIITQSFVLFTVTAALSMVPTRNDYFSGSSNSNNNKIYRATKMHGTIGLLDNRKVEKSYNDSSISQDRVQSNDVTKRFNKKLRKISRKNPERAESLLFETYFEAQHRSARDFSDVIYPDIYSFTMCIQAWGDANKPQRAQALFDRLCGIVENKPFYEHLIPNVITYHGLVRGWCRVGKLDKAKKIVELMEATFINCHEIDCNIFDFDQDEGKEAREYPIPQPDTSIYNCLIDGIAKFMVRRKIKRGNLSRTYANEAQQIVRKMDYLHQNYGLSTKPDIITYNSVLKVLALSGSYLQTEDILKQMEEGKLRCKPDVVSYATVLDSHVKGRSRIAATRATDILERVETNYYLANKDLSLDENRLGGLEKLKSTKHLKPNIELYSTVINAFATNREKSLRSILSRNLLQKVERLYSEGDVFMRPNVILYNSVINSHVKSPNPEDPLEAERIFERMVTKNISPDVVTYNTLISVWANANITKTCIDPCEKVLGLLEDMIARNISPNVKTFNTVLHSLSKQGKPEMAEEFLKEMRDKFQVTPDIFSYNSVIAAWARSSHDQAGLKAEAILLALEENNQLPTPDSVTYCTVMNAWGKVGNPKRSEVLLGRLENIWNSGDLKPTISAFNTVISAYKASSLDDISVHLSRLEERKQVIFDTQ